MDMFWWKEGRITVQLILLLSSSVLIWIQSNSEGTDSRHMKTQPSPRRGWDEGRKHTHRGHRHTYLSSIFHYISGKVKGSGGAVLKRPRINRCKTIRYSDQELPQSCDLTAG